MIGITQRKLDLVNGNEERWATVSEFPDYEVSTKGRVRKWFNSYYRYPTIALAKNDSLKVTFIENKTTYARMLGKLVYETFLGVDSNEEIIYLDGDKTNCCLENLATVRELIDTYRLYQEDLDSLVHKELNLLKRKIELSQDEERWTTVEEFRDYEVSTKGRVRKWFKSNYRYLTVAKAKNDSLKVTFIENKTTYARMLGKLVYETFLKMPSNEDIIYLDGNKENCELVNLATVEELVNIYNLYYYDVHTNINSNIVRRVKNEFSYIAQVKEDLKAKTNKLDTLDYKIQDFIKECDETIVENMGDEAFRKLLDTLDSSGDIEVRQGLVKIRKYNKRIIDELKKEYNHVCQICGNEDTSKVEYGVSIVEGHHIESFALTKDNSPNNLVILCPNHHRLVHKLNAKWDCEKKCFKLDNKQELSLEVNKHL